MTVLKDQRQWTIVDPLRHDAFDTSLGVLTPNEVGYIMTHNEELANEIKAREPWALVTEHEPMVGGRAVRGHSLVRVNKTWESVGGADNPKWVNLGNGRWEYRSKG